MGFTDTLLNLKNSFGDKLSNLKSSVTNIASKISSSKEKTMATAAAVGAGTIAAASMAGTAARESIATVRRLVMADLYFFLSILIWIFVDIRYDWKISLVVNMLFLVLAYFVFRDRQAFAWVLGTFMLGVIFRHILSVDSTLLRSIPFMQSDAMMSYFAIFVMIPVYVFRFIEDDVELSPITKFIARFLAVIFIILLIVPVYLAMRPLGADNGAAVDYKTYFDKVVGDVKDVYVKIKEDIQTQNNKTKTMATEYINNTYGALLKDTEYNGKVEDNSQKQLGVFFDKINENSLKFYDDEDIIVWTTLRAKSLDGPINITVRCYAVNSQNKSDRVEGDAQPQFVTVETQSIQDISCMFPKDSITGANRLTKDYTQIVFEGVYNFKTMGYQKLYFMDYTKMRVITSEGKDPLEIYKIIDKKPVATYTTGPVKLGMSNTNAAEIIPLTGLKMTDKTLMIYGLTISNSQTGKINQIKRIEAHIPKYFVLDTNLCRLNFTDAMTTESGYNAYITTDTRIRNVETFATINCRVMVDQNDVSNILGSNPIKTLYFRAIVDYEYKIEQKGTLTILNSYDKKLRTCDELCNIDKNSVFLKCGCLSTCNNVFAEEGKSCGGKKYGTSTDTTLGPVGAINNSSCVSAYSFSLSLNVWPSKICAGDVIITSKYFTPSNSLSECKVNVLKYSDEASWNAKSNPSIDVKDSVDCHNFNAVYNFPEGYYALDVYYTSIYKEAYGSSQQLPASYKGRFQVVKNE